MLRQRKTWSLKKGAVGKEAVVTAASSQIRLARSPICNASQDVRLLFRFQFDEWNFKLTITFFQFGASAEKHDGALALALAPESARKMSNNVLWLQSDL